MRQLGARGQELGTQVADIFFFFGGGGGGVTLQLTC